MELFDKSEKKVEYIELIYDLIFVYMVGKNNSLIHNIKNGFIEPKSFIAYVICTLAIIQIWNYSTFYINMFGKNSIRNYIFLFINMYLLYFMGQSTNADFHGYQMQYHIAWGLILVNILVQYITELKEHNAEIIKRMIFAISVEGAIIFSAAFTDAVTSGVLTAVAILCGIVLTAIGRRKSAESCTDFTHLSERAMLYVVFTFGEMIIALSSYFTNGFNLNTLYFSLAAFLIVAGLFLSYGIIYDHLIDREGSYDGMLYMMIHIFIVFFLNNITASLEFMREEEVYILPKIMFIVISIVAYFVFLFSLKGYVKKCDRPGKKFSLKIIAMTAAFALLMYLLRENMYINIMITVIYVFTMFLIIFSTKRKRTEAD